MWTEPHDSEVRARVTLIPGDVESLVAGPERILAAVREAVAAYERSVVD
jgi:hypothetical protein